MFYTRKHNYYKRTKRVANYFLLLVIMLLLFSLCATAQNEYPLVRTATNASSNYTLPKNVLKPDEPLTISFSKEPKDEEIFRAHFYEEPLVPMEGKTSIEENAALVFALASFSQRTNPDDFSTIIKFLNQYPNSRWRGALLTNLGIIYRRIGYYSKALEVWQKAWIIMKDEKDKKVKALADRLVAEILEMYCWVGRQNEIDSLLKETDNRAFESMAHERIVNVRAALYLMKSRPGIAFKCGPYALNKLYTLKDSTKPLSDKMMKVQSTGKGFSLYELQQMANAIGLKYQMAFRNPGAPVIENAVVHWKLGHYSALLKKENNHYKCEDATAGTFYGQRFWLTLPAMDSSASGYFLVPDTTLPIGWRKVTVEEGSKIFGKGMRPPPPGPWPEGPYPKPPCTSCPCPGMAEPSIYLSSVNLHISDQPFFYSVPKGPAVNFSVSYNQRDAYQPQNFIYSNIGVQWTFNWLSYIQDDPNNPSADLFQYMVGGGQREITGYNASTNSYAPELYTKDVLERTSGSCYIVHHADGSKEVYGRPDGNTSNGRRIFLTEIVDVAGNAITINYDNNLRITAIKDATGQVTTLKYENADIFKITEVRALGRSAKFEYDVSGRLEKITDMIGIVSSFQYDDNNFITAMTTPYGTTTFERQDGPGNFRSLQVNYPLGAKERAEFKEDAIPNKESDSAIPFGMNVTNDYLQFRNTFYWDKKAMLEGPGDYTKTTIYHWLHGAENTDENGFACPILESIKRPLENRIWYNYQGQSNNSIFAVQGMSVNPSIIGQVLSDGISQLKKFAYNSLNNDTLIIDPSGRSTSYKYDSTGIDLLEVHQTTNGVNELLAKNTYDPNHPHLIKTSADASGQKTTYTYNDAGQIATITNARKENTTFTYDGNGYLKKITGAIPGAATNFTYDGFGRVRTITDAEGYTITTDYDALDRPTLITYPNNSFKQIVYDRLDPVAMKDRRNRWTHYLYDSLRRLNAVTDPSGRITQYIWCTCGNLSEIVDPLKHVTTFEYDLQSRLIKKTYDDGKGITYKYDSASNRLIEKTDAKGQTTKYNYYIDDNIKQIDYTNAKIATPSVYFAYDSKYNRLDTMIDGAGTTAYTYYAVNKNPVPGAGKLKTINGPLQNDDIVYNYDTLGRIKSRSINGVAASSVYDALGRVTSVANALGTFKYSYVNSTNRIGKITNPNSTSTTFLYFDNLRDQRLKEIWNKNSGTTFSKFDYEYDDEGQITKWTQKTNGAPKYYDLGYDLADQLTSATLKLQSNNDIINRYAYQYDKAGNRTSEQIDNSVTSGLYNTLNQETSQQSGGPMRFAGSVNEFSAITINNTTIQDSVTATVDSATNNFESFVKVKAGNNNIKITATDYSGNNNTKTNNYTVKAIKGVNNILQYDDNGNTISATNPAVTYEWDAEDRLVKITHGDSVTTFVYDGLNRRVAEKLNGTIIKRWLWCETELCEERNKAGGTVTKRFFSQGEQINGINYYFTRDHLGTIQGLTNNAGNLITRYDYDPYGRRTKLLGNIDADFGFTGHYFHAGNLLNFTLYRVYDAKNGRWLSRDPLNNAELSEGLNLYMYVKNNTVKKIDPLGLFDYNQFFAKVSCRTVCGGIVFGVSKCGPYGIAAAIVIGAACTQLCSEIPATPPPREPSLPYWPYQF